jgi:hypothetical protein
MGGLDHDPAVVLVAVPEKAALNVHPAGLLTAYHPRQAANRP